MARFRCIDRARLMNGVGKVRLSQLSPAGDDHGCSEKKNLAVASRHAPLC